MWANSKESFCHGDRCHGVQHMTPARNLEIVRLECQDKRFKLLIIGVFSHQCEMALKHRCRKIIILILATFGVSKFVNISNERSIRDEHLVE